MRNGKEFISLCFRDISSRDILEGSLLGYNALDNEMIIKMLERAYPKFSRNELRGYLDYLRDESVQYINEWGGVFESEISLNIFNVLFLYLSDILTVKGDTVVCKYEKLLHWRMLTLDVQEDLLICAYLANNDYKENISRRSIFDWPIVIGHNNTELNMILNQGMAENHFHLKGSAPAFHLAWNYFMNNPSLNNKELILLKDLDTRRRTVSYGVSYNHSEDSLENQILQAAAIRVYLYCRLNGFALGADKKEETEVILYFRNRTNLLNIENKREKICGWINGLRMSFGYLENGLLRDYAVLERLNNGNYGNSIVTPSNPENSSFYRGERRFMYMSFQAIREGHIFTSDEINLFYVYLVIKERFRGEIQQLNRDNVGFENFSIFEERKGYFVENIDLVHNAMQRPLYASGIKYLEARICPYETAKDNRDLINRMDLYIENKKTKSTKMSVNDGLNEAGLKYAYIMHFVKEKDNSLDPQYKDYTGFICRHERLRKKLEQQGQAIIGLRELYPEQGKKIVGIDACNQEIGCRPEVFAPVFRKLKNHSARRINQELNHDVPQLRTTYHVGEDFLDPLDGLRAIYEAVRFLNMGCGDRLGHALALGIDVVEWYETKKTITIPIQDYLDNITWLYFALADFNIKGFDNLKIHIQDEFNQYFNRIYRANMPPQEIDDIMRSADTYYQSQTRFKYFRSGNPVFDIYNYHKAYMLRGDDPKYYRNGYFCYSVPDDYRFNPQSINSNYPEKFDDRLIPEASLLYYYYQFDWSVKSEGAKYTTKKVHRDYIKAVDQVQKKMQKIIAAMGISIETNPTSNFLIGTFKRYDNHPIIKWYNHSLETDPVKLAECPQIQVSINTDDMGVFTTRLDNEFSLMALALERVRDENNNRVYKKSNIYRWINEIREFGINQNFIKQNECTTDIGFLEKEKLE